MSDGGSFRYVQCGLRIRSEVELALPVSTDPLHDVDVRWGEPWSEPKPAPGGKTIASYGEGEDVWYVVAETADGYQVWFRECGDFTINAECSEVVVAPAKTGRPELLPILMAGTVSAILLNLRGATLLHASAVARGGDVLAFVGQSGRGKSTLAALMCVAGAELVADDLLAVTVNPLRCLGGARELRLREKAFVIARQVEDAEVRSTADERLAFAPRFAAHDPSALVGVVIPSPSREADELTFDRLLPTEALMTLLSFPRVEGWTRPEILKQDFAVLSQLVNEIPVWNATIPWGPPFSPDIAYSIASEIGWGSSIGSGRT